MKLCISVSSFISITRSLGFLFNVVLMNSSRSIPVESVYVSVLESVKIMLAYNMHYNVYFEFICFSCLFLMV